MRTRGDNTEGRPTLDRTLRGSICVGPCTFEDGEHVGLLCSCRSTHRSDRHCCVGAYSRSGAARVVLAGDVPPGTDAATLSGLVQTLWHGLAPRADLGADVTELTSTAELAVALLSLERSGDPSR